MKKKTRGLKICNNSICIKFYMEYTVCLSLWVISNHALKSLSGMLRERIQNLYKKLFTWRTPIKTSRLLDFLIMSSQEKIVIKQKPCVDLLIVNCDY